MKTPGSISTNELFVVVQKEDSSYNYVNETIFTTEGMALHWIRMLSNDPSILKVITLEEFLSSIQEKFFQDGVDTVNTSNFKD